jgi:tetratricopeptide (TPR) repeat protein
MCQCHEALVVQERELRLSPGVSEWARDLASTLGNLSSLFSLTPAGRVEALRLQFRVVQLQEKRLLEKRTDPLRQSDLANSYYNLAISLSQVGRNEESVKMFDKSRELREKTALENPAVNRLQAEWAESLMQLGRAQRAEGRFDEALRTFQQTRDIFYNLNQLDPQAHRYRREGARTDFHAAEVLRAMKRFTDAIKVMERAAEVQRGLLKEDAETVDLHHDLAKTLSVLSVDLANQHREEDASRLVEEGLKHERLAFGYGPQVWNYRWTLDSLLDTKGQLERNFGRLDKSAEATLERRKLWGGYGHELYRCGRDLSRDALAVGRGRPVLSEQEREERKKYQDLSLQALTEAVDCGYRDLKTLLTERFLEGVRGRPEFRALLERVRAASLVGPPEPTELPE